MENISITFSTILEIFGAVSVISAGVTVILKVFNPFREIKEKVELHTALLDKDNKRLKEVEESHKILCKSLFALLDHGITGNSIEKLKNAKQEMQEYLIGR